MSFTYTPGNIVVDETSLFGAQAHLPSSETANWPDTARWLARVRHWLERITATQVGRSLLDAMQLRPGITSNIVVKIVRLPRLVNEAFTDGALAPGTPFNASTQPTIFITFTPSDARSGPMNLAPMRQPGSVLAHELMHAYMAIHGLNALTDSRGVPRPIGAWTSTPYPNHNEFCATTLQNMLLSETGSMLSDGYDSATADDPSIDTVPTPGAGSTIFGAAGTNIVRMSNFVNDFRQPLDFLVASLPGFTSRLAALTSVPFNPFAAMNAMRSGTPATRGGSSGASRVPGPVH